MPPFNLLVPRAFSFTTLHVARGKRYNLGILVRFSIPRSRIVSSALLNVESLSLQRPSPLFFQSWFLYLPFLFFPSKLPSILLFCLLLLFLYNPMIPRDSREQRGEQATIKRLRPTILTRPCPHYALPICHTRHRGDPCFRSLSGHAGYIYYYIYHADPRPGILPGSSSIFCETTITEDGCVFSRNKEKQDIILG